MKEFMTNDEWADYFKTVERRLAALIVQQPSNKDLAHLATLTNDRLKELIGYLVDS